MQGHSLPPLRMTDDHHEAEKTLHHAQRVFDQRFLNKAGSKDAEIEVEQELGDKMSGLKGNSDVMRRLRELSGQAAQLWKNRSQLSKKQVLYLTAGLLYFISPVDAVTDVIPLLGYVDDVAVLGWILSQIVPSVTRFKDQAMDQATDQLVDKGRNALNEVVDERTDELLEKLDRAAEDAVQKYVTAVVIGLWGTTTAAALSLAISLISGGYTREWLAYVGVTSLLVLAWNISVAAVFLRQYRSLDQRWQDKLPKIIGAKVGRWRHILAVSLPLLAFVGLACAHLALN